MDFEPILPGFESQIFIIFFYVFAIFIIVQIQHYCLYSDSPTLLPLMMPRPPAPSVFDFLYVFKKNIAGIQIYDYMCYRD